MTAKNAHSVQGEATSHELAVNRNSRSIRQPYVADDNPDKLVIGFRQMVKAVGAMGGSARRQ